MSVLHKLSWRLLRQSLNPKHVLCLSCSTFSSSTGWNTDRCQIRSGDYSVFFDAKRFAGHSKWANIRHVKQANDQARAKELTKFFNFMKAAIKEHGSADPKQNAKLAQVIAQVKEAKLPMASIERNLQKLQSTKDNSSCIYPIRGPGNCIMLIDIESPNVTKTKQELNTVIRKGKGVVLDESILYMFDHKGLLYCSQIGGKSASEDTLDDATMHAIEAGANDVTFQQDHPEFGTVFEFVTEPSAFLRVKGALEKLEYTIVHGEVSYVPNKWADLPDEEMELANKLFSKISEHPDVQKIYVNIA